MMKLDATQTANQSHSWFEWTNWKCLPCSKTDYSRVGVHYSAQCS